MLSLEDLKRIVILTHLTDAMLVNLIEIVDVLKFDDKEIIFMENAPADRFYMLSRGKVILNQRITDMVTACVGSIKPGSSFGWSSMIEDEAYTAEAVSVGPTETYSFRSDEINKLFKRDPEMGLRLYRRLLVVLKKRYDYRTEQFKQSIITHPDMQFACQIDSDAERVDRSREGSRPLQGSNPT